MNAVATQPIKTVKSSIKEVLSNLDDKNKTVFIERLQGKKLSEIGKDLGGLSVQRVAQIEMKTWKDIEKAVENKTSTDETVKLSDFLYRKPKLARRTVKALEKNNIITLRDLLILDQSQLEALRGVGRKNIEEVYKFTNKIIRAAS